MMKAKINFITISRLKTLRKNPNRITKIQQIFLIRTRNLLSLKRVVLLSGRISIHSTLRGTS